METISRQLEVIRKELFGSKCSVVGEKPRLKYVGRMKKCFQSDVEYAAFYEIPYAQKPALGNNQFQAPESFSLPERRKFLGLTLGPEIRTYNAHRYRRKISTQFNRSKTYVQGSSDCLYLNIFLPMRPELIEELLPVLVFIHGGGFTKGSNDPNVITPDSIVQHGVVFVTINYRLGLFGFLNTHTKDCPGNAGLKDQVKALEWIQDNIACFKGDPKNVTLSGCSAGATCVNLHLISPASKDLFHKAIVQSGGIYASWGYRGHRHEQSRMLLRNAEFQKLFFEDKESKTLQECALELLDADRERRHPQLLAPDFGPSVEKFKEGAFIPDEIEEMMKNVVHDKPIMAGITKDEGIHPFIVHEFERLMRCTYDDHKFRQFLMDNLRWDNFDTAARMSVNVIRRKYFRSRMHICLSQSEKEQRFINLVRDIFFYRFYDNFRFGPQRSVHKNLYVYRFDHLSEISAVFRCRNFPDHLAGANLHIEWLKNLYPPQLMNYREYVDILRNATHGDDLKYLYCPNATRRILRNFICSGPHQNREIEEVTNHMCSLWANFCKTGEPKSDFDSNNVEWKRHKEERPCYLKIGSSLMLVEQKSLFEKEWRWFNKRVSGVPTIPSAASTP